MGKTRLSSQVADSIPVLGITTCPWETLNANFLTDTLEWRGRLALVSVSLRHILYWKSNKKKQVDLLQESPKWVWVTIALCLTSMTLSHESGG